MMEGAAQRVTVYVGESDHRHQQSLHEVVVRMLRAEGCAGVTVYRGIMGYGRHSRIHSANILRLSEDLPVVIEFIDTPECVARLVPQVAALVEGGLITVEDVTVVPTTQGPRSE